MLSCEVAQANIENILKVFGAIRFIDAYGTKNPYVSMTQGKLKAHKDYGQ
jgi:hypothetical protein